MKFLISPLLAAQTALAFHSPLLQKNSGVTIVPLGLRNSALASSAVDIAESAPRDVNTLQEWSANYGVQRAEGVELYQTAETDWAVMTSQAVSENSPLMQVPAQMIISSNTAQGDAKSVEAAQQLMRLGAGAEIPQFYLMVQVLQQYEMGSESPWFPWFNSLPRLFFNAVSMTDFCYECLPPLVYRYARAERVKFDNIVSALQKVNGLSAETLENRELLQWAFNVVFTRCVDGSDGTSKVLVPMTDMFNHGTYPNAAVTFDEEGNCIAYATDNVEGGTPLQVSYGCPTNPSMLFSTYGFLDESAPATFCKLTNIQPNEQLENLGYDFSRMLFYKDTGDISQEVWDIMLYTVLEKISKDDQQTFYQAHMEGNEETKQAIHGHYFSETSAALQEHVNSFLVQLEQLSAKSEGRDLNEHPRLPLILKHNEFVKTTFMAVKANLDSIVAQAPVAA